MLRKKDKVATVLFIVPCVVDPRKRALGQIESFWLRGQRVMGGTCSNRIGAAVSMLASPFERIARTIEHSKPATGFAVPHDISKVFPPVGGHLAIELEARNGCHASSGARRARLELKHLELVTGWPPPVIEIAQKAAVFLVDTSREPRLQQLTKRVLQLVGQCSGRGGIEPARSGVSRVRGRAHEPIVL